MILCVHSMSRLSEQSPKGFYEAVKITWLYDYQTWQTHFCRNSQGCAFLNPDHMEQPWWWAETSVHNINVLITVTNWTALLFNRVNQDEVCIPYPGGNYSCCRLFQMSWRQDFKWRHRRGVRAVRREKLRTTGESVSAGKRDRRPTKFR